MPPTMDGDTHPIWRRDRKLPRRVLLSEEAPPDVWHRIRAITGPAPEWGRSSDECYTFIDGPPPGKSVEEQDEKEKVEQAKEAERNSKLEVSQESGGGMGEQAAQATAITVESSRYARPTADLYNVEHERCTKAQERLRQSTVDSGTMTEEGVNLRNPMRTKQEKDEKKSGRTLLNRNGGLAALGKVSTRRQVLSFRRGIGCRTLEEQTPNVVIWCFGTFRWRTDVFRVSQAGPKPPDRQPRLLR